MENQNQIENADPQIASSNEEPVCVSIEPNHECELYEIKYDGQLVFKEILSHSQHLAQMIGKLKLNDDKRPSDDEDSDDDLDVGNNRMEVVASESQKHKTELQDQVNKSQALSARKFFQNIYEKAKLSYDEVCVLLDLVNLVHVERQLMSMETIEEMKDTISSNEERQKELSEKCLFLALRKNNIIKAKQLLQVYITKRQQDYMSMRNSEHEKEFLNDRFHRELLKARQSWRIRKLANKFIGDISYRSVGCIHAIKATFELYKNDGKSKDSSYLNVIIPSELQEYASIRVQIVNISSKRANSNLFDKRFYFHTYNSSFKHLNNWNEKLEFIQNAIYCKEIYNQLIREVFDANTSSNVNPRPIVIGNKIKIIIASDYELVISLDHTVNKNGSNDLSADIDTDAALLEYYLHDLLKRLFDQNFFHYDQRPITSTFAFNSQIKIAGMSYANMVSEEDSITILPKSVNNILNRRRKINLLQSIVEKTEHLILRKKVYKILNKICRKVKEPFFCIQSSAWNSSTSTDITITISSFNYEVLAKAFFYIQIKQSNVIVLNRSANLATTFTDLSLLESYFLDQCCFHQINLLTTVSELLGWTVMSNSFNTQLNDLQLYGFALIQNSKYFKKIAIKVGPVNQIRVFVSQYNSLEQSILDSNLMEAIGEANKEEGDDYTKSSLSMDFDLILLRDNFVPVDIEAYVGLTKIQKFELLLAHFSTTKTIEIEKRNEK